MRRSLQILPWLVPTLVLGVAGLVKLVAPEGTAPRSLTWLTETVPYPLLLRLLGAFELLVAVHVVRPSTRRLGQAVAIALLLAFTLLVATNAHDEAFLADCGCFGPLPLPSVWNGPAPLIVRNALLVTLLATGLIAASVRRPSLVWTLAQATGVGALVLLFNALVVEHGLRRQDHLRQAVQTAGEQAVRFTGSALPALDLVSATGASTSTPAALCGHDHVMFFSPGCAHCRLGAPSWAVLARRLEEDGKRLVLLATDATLSIAEFKEEHGLGNVPHYVVTDRMGPLRWGVGAIPELVVLDADARLLYHPRQIGRETFSQSLATAARRVEGIAADTWDRIAAAVAGEPARCLESPRRAGDLLFAPVETASGERLTLCIGRATGLPAYTIEMAVGIREDGRITRVLPLTTSGYAAVVGPKAVIYDALADETLQSAAILAEERAVAHQPEAPIWGAVGLLLRAVSDAGLLEPQPSGVEPRG